MAREAVHSEAEGASDHEAEELAEQVGVEVLELRMPEMKQCNTSR